MKTMLIIGFLLVVSVPGICDDLIYDRHERCIGRIDDRGVVYDDRYGGRAIGRIEDNRIYDDHLGGKCIGTFKSDDRHDKNRYHDNRGAGAEYLLKESHHNDE